MKKMYRASTESWRLGIDEFNVVKETPKTVTYVDSKGRERKQNKDGWAGVWVNTPEEAYEVIVKKLQLSVKSAKMILDSAENVLNGFQSKDVKDVVREGEW